MEASFPHDKSRQLIADQAELEPVKPRKGQALVVLDPGLSFGTAIIRRPLFA